MNLHILHGRIGKDPELRHTKDGTAVVNFSVATNYKTKEKEITDWHTCIAWEMSAENINKYFKRGDGIIIRGSVKTREYTDNSNVKQYKTETVVDQWEFLCSKKEGSSDYTPKPKPKVTEKPAAEPVDMDDIPF